MKTVHREEKDRVNSGLGREGEAEGTGGRLEEQGVERRPESPARGRREKPEGEKRSP